MCIRRQCMIIPILTRASGCMQSSIGRNSVHWETQYRKVVKEPSCIGKPDTGSKADRLPGFELGAPIQRKAVQGRVASADRWSRESVTWATRSHSLQLFTWQSDPSQALSPVTHTLAFLLSFCGLVLGFLIHDGSFQTSSIGLPNAHEASGLCLRLSITVVLLDAFIPNEQHFSAGNFGSSLWIWDSHMHKFVTKWCLDTTSMLSDPAPTDYLLPLQLQSVSWYVLDNINPHIPLTFTSKARQHYPIINKYENYWLIPRPIWDIIMLHLKYTSEIYWKQGRNFQLGIRGSSSSCRVPNDHYTENVKSLRFR